MRYIYTNTVRLCLSTRLIRLQQATAAIHYLGQLPGANSFKLNSAANWTQDCSSTSSLTDWAIITLATQAHGSFFDRDRWSRLHTYVHTWETKATPSIQGVRYWCCPWKCMLVDMLVSIFFTWTMTVCPSYTCPGWVQESALHTHTHDCIND